MRMFEFQLIETDGYARAGMLKLPHGDVETPTFMPVGTQASVRTLSPGDLEAAGARIVLSNTYHLHVRPGEDVVADLGGLHQFMAWPHPLLTDSGGFQVFSLEGFRKVDKDGVEFQSHVDGGRRKLTPELAMNIQWTLGSDIAMALDHVVPGKADRLSAADALERTLRWLERCAAHHRQLTSDANDRQTLWPILQGATFTDLRQKSLQQVLSIGDWTGIAVGGLAVGETKEATLEVLDGLAPSLPTDIPRYLMGVGFPVDLLKAIARGMDLFDCVAPTRIGRNGSAYTPDGPLQVRNASLRRDTNPLDDSCDCESCRTFSRGYIRHLFAADELLGLRALSLHNVRFLTRLAAESRKQIEAGQFEGWSAEVVNRYNKRGTS